MPDSYTDKQSDMPFGIQPDTLFRRTEKEISLNFQQDLTVA
jgi:hypothetical protein